MKSIVLVSATLAAGLTGCASTLSSMQTAVPVAPKHVQVTGDYGVYVPLGPLSDAIVQGAKQAKNAADAAQNHTNYQLSEDDKQALLTAGIGIAAMPPGTAYEVMVRTGIVDNLDVGVKFSTSGQLKLDGKYRLLHKGPDPETAGAMSPSYDFAVGLGAGKTFFNSPVIDVLDYVKLGDFSRYDVEVPVYFSIEWGEILKFWIAPKYQYSHTSFDEKLVAISEAATQDTGYELSLPETVHTHFIGSSIGFGAGYKWVHFMVELTAGYTYCRPTLFGQQRNLGGLTLYPAVGFQVKI